MVVSAKEMVCGLRKGNDILTLCCLWVLPLECISARVQTNRKEFTLEQ